MQLTLGYFPMAFMLVLARVSTVTAGIMLFGRGRVPMRVMVNMALIISFLFTPLVPDSWAQAGSEIRTLPGLVMAILGEVLLGVAIVLVCDIFMAAFAMAGFIIGFGSSLTMAQSIDPASGMSNNVVSGVLQMVFGLVFILSDGHLVLIKMMFKSFETVPPAMIWQMAALPSTLVAMGGLMFEWGVKLAAPAIAIGMILDTGFGLMARMAPDFDILFMSLPVRLMTGLLTLALTIRYGGPMFTRLSELIINYCGRVFLIW